MNSTVEADRSTATSGIPTPSRKVPFLEAFRVQYGPPGLFGRYFLAVEHIMRERGIILTFATFDELIKVYDQNSENWGFYNPMFDPRTSDIDLSRTMCLVGRDQRGNIVGSASGKYFDASHRTFQDIVNKGDFFSIRPGHNSKNISTHMNAPDLKHLCGRIGYCGGAWVRPDYRGKALASIYTRTMNACMATLWKPDYLYGLLRSEVIGTVAHRAYGFTYSQPTLTIKLNDIPSVELVLLWMDVEEVSNDLIHYLDTLCPQVDGAIVTRRRQQEN
jgi:hypothetical protein